MVDGGRPILLKINEALCSFLQAENLRNFQELQRTSETFFLVFGHKENGIVASRVSVELLIIIFYDQVFSGPSA